MFNTRTTQFLAKTVCFSYCQTSSVMYHEDGGVCACKIEVLVSKALTQEVVVRSRESYLFDARVGVNPGFRREIGERKSEICWLGTLPSTLNQFC